MADLEHPEICPITNAFLIVLRKAQLKHSSDIPLVIFVNKNGATKCLTASKIADVIQAVARTAHPDLTEKEIKKFSAHSKFEFGLVSSSAKQAKALISLSRGFVGWENLIARTSGTQIRSLPNIAMLLRQLLSRS